MPPFAKGFWLPWVGNIVEFGKNPLAFFAKQAEQVRHLSLRIVCARS